MVGIPSAHHQWSGNGLLRHYAIAGSRRDQCDVRVGFPSARITNFFKRYHPKFSTRTRHRQASGRKGNQQCLPQSKSTRCPRPVQKRAHTTNMDFEEWNYVLMHRSKSRENLLAQSILIRLSRLSLFLHGRILTCRYEEVQIICAGRTEFVPIVMT